MFRRDWVQTDSQTYVIDINTEVVIDELNNTSTRYDTPMIGFPKPMSLDDFNDIVTANEGLFPVWKGIVRVTHTGETQEILIRNTGYQVVGNGRVLHFLGVDAKPSAEGFEIINLKFAETVLMSTQSVEITIPYQTTEGSTESFMQWIEEGAGYGVYPVYKGSVNGFLSPHLPIRTLSEDFGDFIKGQFSYPLALVEATGDATFGDRLIRLYMSENKANINLLNIFNGQGANKQTLFIRLFGEPDAEGNPQYLGISFHGLSSRNIAGTVGGLYQTGKGISDALTELLEALLMFGVCTGLRHQLKSLQIDLATITELTEVITLDNNPTVLELSEQ